ncbi:MAG TPA: serine/threonine-protein kinase [Gaiellaceae bacterium]|nr:serine/threonine-protein kinase [Gaiellaceae bacterium]
MAPEVIAGRYRLEEPLGRGSMSAVWSAHDLELDRTVAVKMLAPQADRQRFEREARAAASLSHPNIVSLYDYGRAEDGRPYMVLECLTGGSLEDLLRKHPPLEEGETRRIAADIAAGLEHAHERGLVHRDLKPANILFDAEGRAKIADFGIARMSGTGTLTEAGTVLGTASYLSPEQAAGLPAGSQSDVYSFGVILFRMLTGRLPFESSNAMELVRMHRDDRPPAVTDVRAEAPAALAALAAAALAKDPAARPADGGALLARLDGDETEATQVLPAAGPVRSRRPRLIPAIAGALVLLLGAALALALTRGGGSGGATTEPALSLSLPSVATAGSTTAPLTSTEPETGTTLPTTTARTTTRTEPTTTAPTTTAPTTTAVPTTTAPATSTTIPTTTSAPPTTTVAPPTTTLVTTTAVTTPPTTTTQ